MNKKVSLPQAGRGAYLFCSLSAMEALFDHLPQENYLLVALHRLNHGHIPTYRVCLEHMLQNGNGDLEHLLEKTNLHDLGVKIADAIYLAWRGKKVSELAEDGQ